MAVTIEDTVFESEGLAWAIQKSIYPTNQRISIAYPICPTKKCRVKLDFGSARELTCFNCGRKFTISKDIAEVRNDTDAKFQGSKLWNSQVINLDLLPTKISAREEDENYWVEVKLGQKDGKRMAVVYIGDKTKSGEKAQMFVDVDDEQMRFDKNDKHPMNVVTKLVAYFPKSTHIVEKNEIKKGIK